MRRFFLLVLVPLVVVIAAWLGYRYANRRVFLDSGPLPPPSCQVTFAGSTPEHSFHLIVSVNSLSVEGTPWTSI